MIGILKAMGATNKNILKIFLYKSYFINFKGIIIGNILGLSICTMQYFFNIVSLDAKSYFINYIPIHLDFKLICLISIFTFIITHITIIIPYIIIRRTSPSKLLNTT